MIHLHYLAVVFFLQVKIVWLYRRHNSGSSYRTLFGFFIFLLLCCYNVLVLFCVIFDFINMLLMLWTF